MSIFTLILSSVLVSASLDSTELWVGDQQTLHLQVQQAPEEEVLFPQYGNEIIPQIEIIARSERDTLRLSDGNLRIRQDLTITSFADSLFYIAPIPFVVGGDTLYTEPLTLNVVQPFEVDSTDNAITDIKGIYKAPIWWWGIFRWILLGLGIAGIGVGIYFLIRYLRKRKKAAETSAEEIVELRPAAEVALEKLDKIREEKVWQQGRAKEYHTALTDVIREYISRRFEVSSSEKTSDEILRAMRPLLSEQKDLYEKLRQLLQLADLVKFAKWEALPDENETALQNAYMFVRQTPEVVESPAE